MNSSPALPRMSDFAYRRRNKRFFGGSDQFSSNCSSSDSVSVASTAKVTRDESVPSCTANVSSTVAMTSTFSGPPIDCQYQTSFPKPKALELFDEVNSRWKMQVHNRQTTPSGSTTGTSGTNLDPEVNNNSSTSDDDDDNDDSDENRRLHGKLNNTATDLFDSDNSAGGKVRPRRKKRDSDSDYRGESEEEERGSELEDHEDEEYAVSSANSSDSEKKEWLSKAKIAERHRIAKKRRLEMTGTTLDFYSSIKRRRDGPDNQDSSTRLTKSKSSFEMLKNLRKMRKEKLLKETGQNGQKSLEISEPQVADDSITSFSTNLESEDAKQFFEGLQSVSSRNSFEQRNTHWLDSKSLPLDNNLLDDAPIVVNRKRIVLDSVSSDLEQLDMVSLPTKSRNTALKANNVNLDSLNGESELCEHKIEKDNRKTPENADDSAQSVESSDSEASTDEGEDGGKGAKTRRMVLISSEEENEANEGEVVECELENDDMNKETEVIIGTPMKHKKTHRPKKLSLNDVQLDSIKQARIKGLTIALAEGYAQMLKCQNDLDQLLHSCQKISTNLIASVQELQDGHGDQRLLTQPGLLDSSKQLKPYQLIGLNWLILMHRKELNCILADEMGLGKTRQVFAFLAYLKQCNISGPNLIVVPSSTMDNWLCELRRWCPDLNVLTYYGSLEDRKFLRCDVADKRKLDFDVLLLTNFLQSQETEVSYN